MTLGIGGTDLTAASGLYLSSKADGTNRYKWNHCTTILRGAPERLKYAQPISMEGHAVEFQDKDVIARNLFRSNCYLVRTSGYDGVCGGQTLKDNEFAWVDGQTAATDFVFALRLTAGHFAGNNAAAEVLDSTEQRIHDLIDKAEVRPSAPFGIRNTARAMSVACFSVVTST